MEWWCLGLFMWWYSFLYYETMRLGDVRLGNNRPGDVRLRDDRLGDFRLRVFRSEVCETGKITTTIRCLMSSSLLVSQSPSLKKGLGSLSPPEKIFVYENSVKKHSVCHFPCGIFTLILYHIFL